MKIYKQVYLCFSLLCLSLLAACANQRSAALQVELWQPLSLNFSGPESSEIAVQNPFVDYRLDVTFIGPSGQKYSVPGYFAADGNAAESAASEGNVWQVKFSADEVGAWRYQASFVQGERIASRFSGGLSAGYFDGQRGSFKVVPSTGEAKGFQQSGKIEYVGRHFLQHKGSKNYFLKGGANSPEVILGYQGFDDTPTDRSYPAHIRDWRDGDPTWRNGAGKGLIGLVNYLASLENNVLYFLLMNVEGDGKQVWPWISERDIWRYDVSKLAQWDIVFGHMDSVGIMKNFVLTETENESLFEWYENQSTGGFADSRKIYYREMIARFGHYLGITWNVGEENGWADYSGDDGVKKANTTKQRKQFSDYIRALTYYNDHIVIHNGPDEDYHIFDKDGDNILGHKSITGPSLQGDYVSQKVYDDVLKFRNLSAESGHPWVVTMDEAYIDPPTGNIDVWRKENVWASFMAGGAGIELYLGGGKDIQEQDLRPYEQYYRTTAIALNFFRDNIPFETLEPINGYVENAWTLRNSSGFYLIYFKQDANTSLDLADGEYNVRWFDPRSGIFAAESTVLSEGKPVELRAPSDVQNDWALILERSN